MILLKTYSHLVCHLLPLNVPRVSYLNILEYLIAVKRLMLVRIHDLEWTNTKMGASCPLNLDLTNIFYDNYTNRAEEGTKTFVEFQRFTDTINTSRLVRAPSAYQMPKASSRFNNNKFMCRLVQYFGKQKLWHCIFAFNRLSGSINIYIQKIFWYCSLTKGVEEH
jgi:hypothetical protein